MSNTDVKAKVKRQKAKVRTRALPAGRARLLAIFCLLPFAFLLSSCRMDMQDQPKYIPFRAAGDKKFSPDGSSSRAPVEGTVARQFGDYRDRDDYFYTGKMAGQAGGGGGQAGPPASSMAATAANALGNTGASVPGTPTAATGGPDVFPITIDRAAVERGRNRFNIYCIVCHGATGEGDGMIVRRGYRKPPSYYDDKLQEGAASAAHFFDVITNGWGAMPDYAAQVSPEDRWKIIAYIRALQLSRKLKMNDLSPDEQQKVLSSAQKRASEESEGTSLRSTEGGGNH
jgi:mono/diheme cytochrome c family protein